MARTVLDEVPGDTGRHRVHPSPVWRVPATMRVVGAGAGPAVDGLKRMLDFCGRSAGVPAQVLDNLRAIEEIGISPSQVTDFMRGTIQNLARELQ